ncbi:signal peptidase II [Oceanivirga salmonicida]|uniref:signal peptidase II n=1 Tax=Oceanivirga salmonicida TaxID=1769291 RepID=UPI00082B343A|nr:signal peptidase II [Oceanivirga salmonicida]
MESLKNKSLIYIVLIFLLVSMDQLSKQAMLLLSNGVIGYSMKILGNFFRITYVENHGGVFGVFQGHIKTFTLISTILIIYIYFSELKNFSKYAPITKLGTSFIIAGAAGNMIDRFFRGYVIDMLDFRAIWHYVFNVADVYIHIGIYILVISYVINSYIKKEK